MAADSTRKLVLANSGKESWSEMLRRWFLTCPQCTNVWLVVGAREMIGIFAKVVGTVSRSNSQLQTPGINSFLKCKRAREFSFLTATHRDE